MTVLAETPRGTVVLVSSHRFGADAYLDVVEHAASRIDILVAFLGCDIHIGLTNFGKAATLGVGAEWRYISEKLGIAEPDARAVAEVIRYHEVEW